MVQFCRLSKNFKADTLRITRRFAASPEGLTLKSLVVKALAEKGWERRFGRAAKSHIEREFQGFLDKITRER